MTEEGGWIRELVYSPLEDDRYKARLALDDFARLKTLKESLIWLGITRATLDRWYAHCCNAEPTRERVNPLEGRTYTEEQASATWPVDRTRVRWSRDGR